MEGNNMDEKSMEEFRKSLKDKISDELAEKLKTAKSDVEFCKMLADNGVDVEKLQRTLPDEILDNVSGGYRNYGQDVYCPDCHNGVEDEISYQYLTSLWRFKDVYRCRKCDTYFQIDNNGSPYKVEG